MPSSSKQTTSKPGDGFPVEPALTVNKPRPAKFPAIAQPVSVCHQ